jgi:cell division protein FtsQ
MERSVAARSPIGSLDILWRPFEALAGLARSGFRAISRHRRLRNALLTALIALPLLAGGWMLLRKSSFVAVEHVRVSGVHGPQAHAIDAALAGAAEHMSTLEVHPAALRAAVASFPIVQSVKAIPRFPHGLRIEVTEQPPVAALTIGGTRTAVAADGVVLGPMLLSGSLPALSAGQSAVQPLTGQHVQGQSLLAELAVLGAVPKPLQRYITRVYTSSGGQGLTVAMRSGLLVYFGDAWRPHAKWLSLARVLASPTSAGATYVDVRVPERPAAGFSSGGALSSEATSGSTGAAGSTSSTSSTTGQGQATTPESTVAALAAGLTDDTNGEPAAAATAATGTTSTSEASTEPQAASAAAPEAESGSGSGDSGSSTETESTPPGG